MTDSKLSPAKQKPHHDGHRSRLKDRFAKSPEALQDYEILELLLGYPLLRKDTKPLAKDLLRSFSSFAGLLSAKPAELENIDGIGKGVSMFLDLLREFYARTEEMPLRKREILATPENVARAARKRLGHLGTEQIWAAFVDSRHRLLAWKMVGLGTVDNSTIHTEELISQCITLKAKGVILVHNHPGGDPRPSRQDIELTEKISKAAEQINKRLFDHLIITDSAAFSINELRLL